MHHWIWMFHEWGCRSNRWWLFWSSFFWVPVWRTICAECSSDTLFPLAPQSQTVPRTPGWMKEWCAPSEPWHRLHHWQSTARRIRKLAASEAMPGRPKVPPEVYIKAYFFHADTFSRQTCLFQDGEWSEDVLLDHVNDKVEMGNDDGRHASGIGQQVIELLQVTLPICLLLDMFGVIVQVQGRRTGLELFQKLISWIWNVCYLNSRGRCFESWVLPVVVVGAFVTGPFVVVVGVGFGLPLIDKLRINIIIWKLWYWAKQKFIWGITINSNFK